MCCVSLIAVGVCGGRFLYPLRVVMPALNLLKLARLVLFTSVRRMFRSARLFVLSFVFLTPLVGYVQPQVKPIVAAPPNASPASTIG